MAVHTITPCLWFDGQAEEAARLYTSVFPNSRITAVSRYPDAGQEIHGQPAGSVMTVAFELDGQQFTALNGGPNFKFGLSRQVIPSVLLKLVGQPSESSCRAMQAMLRMKKMDIAELERAYAG